ncbi:MAG: M28 family peptidase [Candidatus Woesebacteria bacterium]|nr:M28 family peptidase [Candidatus Woesebacteria bacterium]
MKKLIDLLQIITLAPFHLDKGARLHVIRGLIKNQGLKSFIDGFGNLWVKKGQGPKRILIDAHMDTVFGLRRKKYFFSPDNGHIMGTLDNSVGCAIAMISLQNFASPSDIELNIVFSVKEEVGGQGVRYIIQNSEQNFDLCITIDLTDAEDGEMVYCENFSSRQYFSFCQSQIASSQIGVRQYALPDNGVIYGRRWNSVSVCPVSYGHMHSSSCMVPVSNILLALDVIKKMIGRE